VLLEQLYAASKQPIEDKVSFRVISMNQIGQRSAIPMLNALAKEVNAR
jgi:hypothetical protein